MAYSTDLRIRIIEAYNDGKGTIRELAELFSVNKSTVEDWLKLYRETGDILPRTSDKRGRKPKLTDEVLQTIRELLEEKNDLTDDELHRLLIEKLDVSISPKTLNRGVHKIGFSRKKKRFLTPKEMKRE